jgi:hypothetical protein
MALAMVVELAERAVLEGELAQISFPTSHRDWSQ